MQKSESAAPKRSLRVSASFSTPFAWPGTTSAPFSPEPPSFDRERRHVRPRGVQPRHLRRRTLSAYPATPRTLSASSRVASKATSPVPVPGRAISHFSPLRKKNALEKKWIIMIIVKAKGHFSMDYPDAEDLFNVACDPKFVCKKLRDCGLRRKRQNFSGSNTIWTGLLDTISNILWPIGGPCRSLVAHAMDELRGFLNKQLRTGEYTFFQMPSPLSLGFK
ncbi:hypothetical protein NL676_006906 [Syzygium grande]|nr:hypothetical protein NL676_006906 [Syzygium grande]